MHRPYKKLDLERRLKIRELLDHGYSIRAVSRELGCTYKTICDEIARCPKGQYDPYAANADAKSKATKAGKPTAINPDSVLAAKISELILDEGMSVPHIVTYLSTLDAFDNPPRSHATIYKAIDQGLIPGVTRETLLTPRRMTKMTVNGSITIPKLIRTKFGFQEGDIFEIWASDDGNITIKKRT